jgi:2-phospho-L-lactate guanylyltransferase
MRTLAVLPVKAFSRAKQRLKPTLDPRLRGRLAEAMVCDVLSALQAAAIDEVLVVTADARVGQLAQGQGARVLTDDERGHNPAAQLGIEEAIRSGAERVLLVPGDCPALDASELNALLAPHRQRPSVVIVPDRHGTGTNALLLTPPDALAPSFGPGSAQRHATNARAAGIACQEAHVPSLALDIDTADDLDALASLPDQPPHTYELLARC